MMGIGTKLLTVCCLIFEEIVLFLVHKFDISSAICIHASKCYIIFRVHSPRSKSRGGGATPGCNVYTCLTTEMW